MSIRINKQKAKIGIPLVTLAGLITVTGGGAIANENAQTNNVSETVKLRTVDPEADKIWNAQPDNVDKFHQILTGTLEDRVEVEQGRFRRLGIIEWALDPTKPQGYREVVEQPKDTIWSIYTTFEKDGVASSERYVMKQEGKVGKGVIGVGVDPSQIKGNVKYILEGDQTLKQTSNLGDITRILNDEETGETHIYINGAETYSDGTSLQYDVFFLNVAGIESDDTLDVGKSIVSASNSGPFIPSMARLLNNIDNTAEYNMESYVLGGYDNTKAKLSIARATDDPENTYRKYTHPVTDDGQFDGYFATGGWVPSPDTPQDVILKVGTKPTVERKETPFDTIYKSDDTLEAGQTVVETEGQNGVEETVTTYKMSDEDYKVSIDEVKTNTIEKVDKVVRVGTKTKVEVTKKDIPVVYEEDDTLEFGERNEIEGSPEVVENTTNYTMDENGNLTDNASTVVRDKGKPKVVKVGTKPKVENKEVPHNEIDPNSLKPNEIIEKGSAGMVEVTTEYQVDKTTGEVTEIVKEKVIVEPKDDIVVQNEEIKPDEPKVEPEQPSETPEESKPADPTPEVKPDAPKEGPKVEQPEEPKEPKTDAPEQETPKEPKVETPEESKPVTETDGSKLEVKPAKPKQEEPKVETSDDSDKLKPETQIEKPKDSKTPVEQPATSNETPKAETSVNQPKDLPKVEAKSLPKTGDENTGILAGLLGLLAGVGLIRRKKRN